MAFTAGELANIANATLDYYWDKPKWYDQSINNKPLVKLMEGKRKAFPGGKGDINVAVQGVYGAGGTDDSLVGFTHNDTVGYYNPANIQRANYPWREHHIGLTITGTEMKHNGMSMSSDQGIRTTSHPQREMTELVNLLDNKLEDMSEQVARSLNNLFWGDGTGDAKAMAGILSLVTDDPTTGTVGGIDRSVAANAWWRNLAYIGGNAITSSPANGGALITALQDIHRKLTLYSNGPTHFLCGSGFLEKMEIEMRANGYYSDSGFSNGGDVSVGTIKFKGTPLVFDPWLDQNSRSNHGYWLDLNSIGVHAMSGEWRKRHNPARPYDKYVYYSSLTYTGQVTAKRLNSSAVIQAA